MWEGRTSHDGFVQQQASGVVVIRGGRGAHTNTYSPQKVGRAGHHSPRAVEEAVRQQDDDRRSRRPRRRLGDLGWVLDQSRRTMCRPHRWRTGAPPPARHGCAAPGYWTRWPNPLAVVVGDVPDEIHPDGRRDMHLADSWQATPANRRAPRGWYWGDTGRSLKGRTESKQLEVSPQNDEELMHSSEMVAAGCRSPREPWRILIKQKKHETPR